MLIQQHDKIERFRTGLCFDDVLLVPQFSETLSRKEISLEASLGKFSDLICLLFQAQWIQ